MRNYKNFEEEIKKELKILDEKFIYSLEEANKIVEDLITKKRVYIVENCVMWLDKNNKCTEKEAECIAIYVRNKILKKVL